MADSDAADSEADDVEFDEPEDEAATEEPALAEDSVDDAADVAALALEEATAEEVEFEAVVVVVAPDTADTANAATSTNWRTFMMIYLLSFF